MIENVIIFEFLVALAMGLGALAFFIWAVLSNQMDDLEDIKYRVLERETEDHKSGLMPIKGEDHD